MSKKENLKMIKLTDAVSGDMVAFKAKAVCAVIPVDGGTLVGTHEKFTRVVEETPEQVINLIESALSAEEVTA